MLDSPVAERIIKYENNFNTEALDRRKWHLRIYLRISVQYTCMYVSLRGKEVTRTAKFHNNSSPNESKLFEKKKLNSCTVYRYEKVKDILHLL